MKNKIDKAKIQKAIKDVLEAIGENPERVRGKFKEDLDTKNELLNMI